MLVYGDPSTSKTAPPTLRHILSFPPSSFPFLFPFPTPSVLLLGIKPRVSHPLCKRHVLSSGHPGELRCRCVFPFPSSPWSLLSVLLLKSDYTPSRASEGLLSLSTLHRQWAASWLLPHTGPSQFPTVCGAESRTIHKLPSRSENGILEEGRSWEHSRGRRKGNTF